jgi:hypothetical protein
MTKLVNLDELAGTQRSVKFKGAVHDVINLSLLDFVKAQQTVEALSEAFKKNDYNTVIEGATTVCGLAVPSLKTEDIRSMSMSQIMALVQCVMDVFPDAQKEVKDANAAKTPATEGATGKA